MKLTTMDTNNEAWLEHLANFKQCQQRGDGDSIMRSYSNDSGSDELVALRLDLHDGRTLYITIEPEH
jgi:hypothetical protein